MIVSVDCAKNEIKGEAQFVSVKGICAASALLIGIVRKCLSVACWFGRDKAVWTRMISSILKPLCKDLSRARSRITGAMTPALLDVKLGDRCPSQPNS